MKDERKVSMRLSQKDYDLVMSFAENKKDNFSCCFRLMLQKAYEIKGEKIILEKKNREKQVLQNTYFKLNKIVAYIEKSITDNNQTP